MTTTFCVPRPRESLNDCWSHSPIPRFETIRHASSTTTIRFALRSSVSASIIAWSQAVAQVMRIPSAVVCVLSTARRLRTTRGAPRSRPGRRRPVEHPAGFPEQSWSSANAIGRVAAASSSDGIASASAISPGAWMSTSTTRGQSRLAGRPPLDDVERLLRRSLLLGRERPLERGRRDRVEEVELPLGPPRGVSGFSRTPPPGESAIGRTPIASASRSYSPLTSTIHACRPKTACRKT